MANGDSKMLDAIHKLARAAYQLSFGPGRAVLSDMASLDPDSHRGVLVGMHVDIAASNNGLDVDFRTNPDFDMAIHSVRAAVEVGTAEATANSGGPAYSASHVSVKLRDADRNLNIFDGSGPAAGGDGGIDLMLLGANAADEVELKVPYVFKGQKGASTVRATFATDADWPGTRRAGILLSCSYRRRSSRQTEVI